MSVDTPQCVVTYDMDLRKKDRKAWRYATRKVSNITNIKFRRVPANGLISVKYGDVNSRYVAWAAVQGKPVIWAGITVSNTLPRVSPRHTFMHELGHVFWLPDRFDSDRHIMYYEERTKLRWSKADRRGLREGIPNVCPQP